MALLRKLVIGTTGIVSYFFTRYFMRTEVVGAERLRQYVLEDRKRGLLTISNHTTPIDDPFLWGSLLPLGFLALRGTDLRWSLGAEDVVFRVRAFRPLFRAAQVISVTRGLGLWQPGIESAIERLRNKEWIHIFPEAYVNQTGLMRPLRWGTARLIMEGNCPTVLPIWHLGLENVMPEKTLQIPRPGKRARVIVGEPIDFEPLLRHHRHLGTSHEQTRAHIMLLLTETMLQLQARAQRQGGVWDVPLPDTPRRTHPIETGTRPDI